MIVYFLLAQKKKNLKKYLPKLVFITSRFPYPLEKGDKLRAFFFIKELSKNYEVVLISLSDKKIEKKQFQKIEEICAKVYFLQLKTQYRLYQIIKKYQN